MIELLVWLVMSDSNVGPMHISAHCLPKYFNHVENNILNKVHVGGFGQNGP